MTQQNRKVGPIGGIVMSVLAGMAIWTVLLIWPVVQRVHGASLTSVLGDLLLEIVGLVAVGLAVDFAKRTYDKLRK